MSFIKIHGLEDIEKEIGVNFIELNSGGDGMWKTGENGVKLILTPLDRKVEFIVF